MSKLPISEYALLSDCHSAALVSREGSVDWLCVPRFDSPSVFARILGEAAGHWSIRATPGGDLSRRYLEGTLVLETTFTPPSGKAVLTEAMAMGRNERGHELGAQAPHALLRLLRGLEGEVLLEVEYVPRPDYGLNQPILRQGEGLVVAQRKEATLLLSTGIPLDLAGGVARARLTLRAGESIGFALQWLPAEGLQERWSQAEIVSRLTDTVEAWRSWSEAHQAYQGPWKAQVHLSGRILQGLTYYPTGAMVAAPTTSLPEFIGGARNWDYRYCWVRDASLTLDALWVAACPDEAYKFFDFLAGAAQPEIQRHAALPIMFRVGGERAPTERELSHLPGWRNSRPVRIGNAASAQTQLDVYGELYGAAYRLKEQLGGLKTSSRSFLVEAAEAAIARWEEPDHGIWEMRTEPRHFLYSKVMCWVALDRAIKMGDFLSAQDRLARWKAVRAQIRSAILEKGWSEGRGAFTQAFGSEALDASNLVMPIVGFLPATDPRVRATIEAIAAELSDPNGLVYRYRTPDGVQGDEGSFLLCTFWLAHALALAGEVERARSTFERAIAFANDLNLLAEEVDPRSRELLGNFPQAFSHIGLINAAWAITLAEARHPEKPEP